MRNLPPTQNFLESSRLLNSIKCPIQIKDGNPNILFSSTEILNKEE